MGWAALNWGRVHSYCGGMSAGAVVAAAASGRHLSLVVAGTYCSLCEGMTGGRAAVTVMRRGAWLSELPYRLNPLHTAASTH